MLINGHFGLFLVHFLVFQFERLCSRTFSSSSGDLRPHVSCVFGEMAVKRGGSIPCHNFPGFVLSGTYATRGLTGAAFCVEKCAIWYMMGGGLPCHDFPCLVLSGTYAM